MINNNNQKKGHHNQDKNAKYYIDSLKLQLLKSGGTLSVDKAKKRYLQQSPIHSRKHSLKIRLKSHLRTQPSQQSFDNKQFLFVSEKPKMPKQAQASKFPQINHIRRKETALQKFCHEKIPRRIEKSSYLIITPFVTPWNHEKNVISEEPSAIQIQKRQNKYFQ